MPTNPRIDESNIGLFLTTVENLTQVQSRLEAIAGGFVENSIAMSNGQLAVIGELFKSIADTAQSSATISSDRKQERQGKNG